MTVKFIEVTEDRRNDENELVPTLVLKIVDQTDSSSAVTHDASEEDKEAYAQEYAKFLDDKKHAGFDAYLKEKDAELKAQFLASKSQEKKND